MVAFDRFRARRRRSRRLAAARQALVAANVLLAAFLAGHATALAEPPGPLKVLLVCGGCCHDYAAQQDLLKQGLEARAHVAVTIARQGGDSGSAKIPLYERADWSRGYDLVIHDECFAGVQDVDWAERVLKPHRAGLPGVVLHCAMHSYRNGTDNWFEFCGVTSRQHGDHYGHEVLNCDGAHPIMRPLGPGWFNPRGELYWIEKVWPAARPLATAKNRERGGEEVCAWTNDYHGTRVFGTTLGHDNETVANSDYLDLVARGVLWACDKLDDAYLKPAAKRRVPVNLAVGKKATASSSEKGHPPEDAIDGKQTTRWCAASGAAPQWWQVDLGSPQRVNSCWLTWESPQGLYRYQLAGSIDGAQWRELANHDQVSPDTKHEFHFEPIEARYVRVNFAGSGGGWASLWETRIEGDQTVEAGGGDEAWHKSDALLASLKTPAECELTVFAAPPSVAYPVSVAAAPDGVLYVSVDKNGSVDREKNRGAVYRLRDLDGDGHADECKLFIPNVDSPRGLVWDRDRLYLMHPPHLSAFIDHDGDGHADEERVLVKNIAFGFKDRPADHTSNGVTLGVDGWLFLAIGDFGFLEAEGADGRKLQFRSGGVIRVRTDGRGLEAFSRGTRNILEVALDPLLNGFTRDNTNDGGGWDIRLHHFTGLENHGYPRLFKNFNDEIVQPLADYGGGSGCGALYLDEPGFPAGASPAVYTADWGRDFAYRHHMTPHGATFKPDQQEFLQLPRITDLDVDANSHIFASSWKGATFTYNGEEVGFVVRVTPKGAQPAPLPDFAKADEAVLLEQLASPSGRRRLAAQRELLARGLSHHAAEAVFRVAADASTPLATRVLAIFTLKQALGVASHPRLAELAKDAALRPFAIRALADRWDELEGIPAETLFAGLTDPQPRTRLESLVALARWGKPEHAAVMTPLLADADPVVAHTAVETLALLGAAEASFAVVDRTDASLALRAGALRVLQTQHTAAVVDGLIDRLDKETNDERRHGLLVALCRLYNVEGRWTGASWGTRPDTTGPYYQPEAWGESPKIAAVLKRAIDAAPESAETAFLLKQMNRHRVRLPGLLDLVLASAARDPSFLPQAVGELAKAPALPKDALPLLKQAATSADQDLDTVALAAATLMKLDDSDAFEAVLTAAERLSAAKNSKALDVAKGAFLSPGALAHHVDVLVDRAPKLTGAASVWCDAGLLALVAAKDTSPETRSLAKRSIDAGWEQPARRAQILRGALLANQRSYEGPALAAVGDRDPQVAAAGRAIVAAWKLDQRQSVGPAIATLKPEQVLALVAKQRGDVGRGEQLFVRLNCGKCHTIRPDEPLRGPFLPQVARTYKRDQIAEAVLTPSKSIAQGFATHLFVLDDGRTVTGFITNEAADEITLRDAEAREIKLPTAKIEEQVKQNVSIMPEGLAKDLTVEEFASLVSYVESLASH